MYLIRSDSSITNLDLSEINLDEEVQPRKQTNQAVVQEYTGAMKLGAKFPPVTVFYDGAEYWLADGFHRVRAKESIGQPIICAEVWLGSRRDAILFSAGANTIHGFQRTNEDKRRVVERLLKDSEWNQWSDNAIAKKCGVSNTFVGKLRHQLSPTFNGWKSKTRRGIDGRVINTHKIGQKRNSSRM
ncbi:hypothetical protein [Acaryochloris marina]|uniref:ParB-like N-terminal domain-containing protein n=2 Tax=Acaryochloris marina TaxID=155978 RepID=A8ZK48_ACAM1|nr:hypothetical protein [Acaryochloris marina]ABW31548.1 conserved hypothetical protein [Acaryochloris marina MBIC11017]BDM83459.1 hypothetical protein AM10699_63200 [Acaryochloris marina MBIC10699]